MLNNKILIFVKILNYLSIFLLVYFISQNILSFFNQVQYRHLHVDERLVVMNPIINVYYQIDIFNRFSDLTPGFLKSLLIIASEMVLGGTLDYGRIYNNLFILFAGPFSFYNFKMAIISGRIIQLFIFIYSLFLISKHFLKKEFRVLFIFLSLGLPGAYYILQNPKPDSLAILFFIIGIKYAFINENYRKSFIFMGLSIGTKVITLLPGLILGLYLIFPLKKIKTIKKAIEVVFMTFFGILIAQPALFLPLPRIYNRVFSAILGSSSYDQEQFFLLNFNSYKSWINQLSKEHSISNIFFTILFVVVSILLIENFYKKSNLVNSYFLLASISMIVFVTFNVQRTWNYYLFIPFLFMLIYFLRLEKIKMLSIFAGLIIFVISVGGLFLHNDKAVNSYFEIDETKDLSLDLAIKYIDNEYSKKEYSFKKVYWDPDYYFPGKNIDYFYDYLVVENWEEEKQTSPLNEKVDFIVSTKVFYTEDSVKVSQYGDLYVYEK
jgi:hypothetical protein